MATTYDVLGRVIVTDSASESSTVRREDLETAFTEKISYVYTVAGSTTDLELPLGGLSNADVLFIESETANESWSFKLNADTNTAIAMDAQGWMLLKGATVTALFVTVAGATAVNIKVTALD